MRRIHQTLFTLIALAILITGCGGSSKSSEKSYSGISINVSNAWDANDVSPQRVVIELGRLTTWRLKITARYNKVADTTLSVDAVKVSNPADAKQLDLSNTVHDNGEYLSSGETTRSFTVTLVEGDYCVNWNGDRTPVCITVTKSASTGSSTQK